MRLTMILALAATVLASGCASSTSCDASAAISDVANWQKYLPDDAYVAHLSIPGTHDTMTAHPWIDNGLATAEQAMARSVTQEVLLADQLAGGIRALDLRPGIKDGEIYCGHGATLTQVTLREAMDTLCAFIDRHPTEFFFIHLFRGNVYAEGTAGNATLYGCYDDASTIADYAAKLEAMFNPGGDYAPYIIDYDPMLKVADMRGKIVLLRRDRMAFVNLASAGNLDNWSKQYRPDDPTVVTNASKPHLTGLLHVQDVSSPYLEEEDADIEAEKRYCLALLADARKQPGTVDESSKPFWVMNFLSGEYGTDGGTEGYKQNASIMNPLAINDIRQAAARGEYGPAGIVFADYALIDSTADGRYRTDGRALVATLIASNFHPK